MSGLHLSTCLHPVRIVNRATGSYMYVGCGKCENCVHKLRAQWSERIKAEVRASAAALFVTLTYDNEHLPVVHINTRFQKSGNIFVTSNRPYIEKMVKKYSPTIEGKQYSIPHFKKNTYEYDKTDTFGVVCKDDVQKFIKRCRRYMEYHYPNDDNRTFRYFVCAEYGGKTFRPHYHGVFLFKSPSAAQYFQTCALSACWKHSSPEQIKCAHCSEGGADYLSKYVGKSVDAPAVLQCSPFRVFHLQSKSPCFGSCSFPSVDKGVLSPLVDHSCRVDSYWSKKDNTNVSRYVPYNIPSTKQYFPDLTSGYLLDTSLFLRCAKHLYDIAHEKYVEPQYIDISRYTDLKHMELVKWSNVARQMLYDIEDALYHRPQLADYFIRKYLFGIPQNKRFSKRIIKLFRQCDWLDSDMYTYLWYKNNYNKFYNSISRQYLFVEDSLRSCRSSVDKLKLFQSVYPFFVEDMDVPVAYNNFLFFDKKYDVLDLLLSNYDLRVEDLYDDKGLLRPWFKYEDSKGFQEYTNYVNNEKIKSQNISLINSKIYNDL